MSQLVNIMSKYTTIYQHRNCRLDTSYSLVFSELNRQVIQIVCNVLNN